MDEDAILNELKRVNSLLALIAVEPKVKLLEKLKEKRLLGSDQRFKMFLLMDGRRTTPEISRLSGVGDRAVQIFIQELEKKELVTTTRAGHATVPTINYEKLAEYLASAE